MEFALANGITQFAEGEPKRRNNDTVRVYQPLEGGNEVSEANVVTLCSKGEIPYCVSRKRPLDGACLGRQLDGFAVKRKSDGKPSHSKIYYLSSLIALSLTLLPKISK